MEEEISLKEIIAMLWQGRWLIVSVTVAAILIALFSTLFLIDPTYKTTAYINLNVYLYEINEEKDQLYRHYPFLDVLQSEITELPEIDGKVDLDICVETGIAEVTVETKAPEKTEEAVKVAGIFIFEHIAKNLRAGKEDLELWLDFFDEKYSMVYINYLNREEQVGLADNPSYIYIMDHKGKKIAELHEINYRLHELESKKEELVDKHMYLSPPPREPVNMNWRLNTAVAGVLGLMLSVFIVFVKPYFNEFKEGIKASERKDE